MIRSVMLAPTIDNNKSMCVEAKVSWVDPIKYYLRNGTLSEDKKAADKAKKAIIPVLFRE